MLMIVNLIGCTSSGKPTTFNTRDDIETTRTTPRVSEVKKLNEIHCHEHNESVDLALQDLQVVREHGRESTSDRPRTGIGEPEEGKADPKPDPLAAPLSMRKRLVEVRQEGASEEGGEPDKGCEEGPSRRRNTPVRPRGRSGGRKHENA